jgi:D-cysteine desulfhydrase
MHDNEPVRVRLALLPTPVVELPRLARYIGVPRLLMKRDDLSGFELSGNKVRKLEYVVADAQRTGATTLVTHGGFQSNHCRATAAIGARLGVKVRLILRSPEPAPTDEGNLFLDRLFGAEVQLAPVQEYNSRKQGLIEAAMDAEHAAGRKPYFFPVGASIPLGCWGYIRCIAELVEQLGRDTPVDVYCATSSGGTQVGLMLGKALLGCRNWRILGVPVSDSVGFFQQDLRRLERQTAAEFKLDLDESQTVIELLDGFIGEGYAIPYRAEIETIRLVARLEGILLDPTYTGKAMTGMLEQLKAGGGRPDATPIFLHTGGAFGLMARRDLFTA